MEQNLKKLFINHNGKISDKWRSYLNEWDSLFSPLRENKINLLEIGVHNGGSLEIWAKYFANAEHIIGCDINEACSVLDYSDSRISTVIGDINTTKVEKKISLLAPKFDIIIDDGSHKSSDIIQSFARYFKKLNSNGLYLIEDLHASYWESFEGGLYDPFSAISFFKRLIDIVNFEHWRNNKSPQAFLLPYQQKYEMNLDEFELNSIHSIQFINSLCIIKKGCPDENKLGKRVVVGSQRIMPQEIQTLNATTVNDIDVTTTDDHESDIFFLLKQRDTLTSDLEKQSQSIQQLQTSINEQKQAIVKLEISIEDYKLANQVLTNGIQERDQSLQQLRADVDERDKQIQEIKTSLYQKNQSIQQLQVRLTTDNNQLHILKQKINNLEQEIIFYAVSKSWQLTRYIRKTLNLLSGTSLKDLYHYLLIKRSGLFDSAYYLQTNPDISKMGLVPLMHFIKTGWKEERDPSSAFSIQQYLYLNPEIKDIGINPLIHFIKSKQIKSDNIRNEFIKGVNFRYHYRLIKRSGLFDEVYYIKTNPDVRRMDINPLMHFIKYGWKEGRNPSKTFSIKQYFELYPELKAEGLNPLVHYLQDGRRNTRKLTSSIFDETDSKYLDLFSHEARMKLIKTVSNNSHNLPDIIIFPIIDWDFRFQRPQQLALEFSKMGHRVFYLKFTPDDDQRNPPLIKMVQNNIYSIQLSTGEAQIDFSTPLTRDNFVDLGESIQFIKDHFLINSAIVKVDFPYWAPLVIYLKEKFDWKVIFDYMDLFSGFSTTNYSDFEDEKRLLGTSDLVLASSHLLFNHAISINENTLLVPNATNFSYFHQAKETIHTPKMAKYSRPIIGYYGAISDWFDSKLVSDLAQKRPDWTFVLIGDTHLAELEPLCGLSNVHMLGEKPYSDLVEFLSNFDVCIIPFKDLPLTNATNPVKLFEYLSAGKPIVATKLHELSFYEDYVKLAQNINEWESAIEESLSEKKSTERLEKRYNFAQSNTWEKRAKEIEKEIIELFPKISIIVVTHNNLAYTKLCLNSIIQNTSYPNYEIIVVDNGSGKGLTNYLNRFCSNHQNVKIVLNHENLGFSKANNQGFAASEGEYIVFLNNDTIVTPGWMHRLLFHLKNNPSAGMIGPVTNSIGNEAQINVPYTDLSELHEFSAHRTKNFYGKSFKIKVLALFCGMISRDLFESVGGLDERYKVGLFEDDDLAMKIRQKGLDLICAEDVFVHHFHGASFNKLDQMEYQNILNENKKRFEHKWGVKWEPHQHRL